MEEKENTIILINDGKYYKYKYKNEKELEILAEKHYRNIFGKKSFYINLKKKLSSSKGISSIPDGFIVDFERQKFYIVEIELSTHDIIRHISNQIFRFKLAMNNNNSRESLINDICEKLKDENVKEEELRKIIYKNLSIVIIIDEVSEQLNEVVALLSQEGSEVITVSFETYLDSNGKKAHRFSSFTKEELERESKKWNFKWTTIPIEKHLDKTNNEIKNIFSELGREINSFPNVAEKSRIGWVTYQTSPLKNFCSIKLKENCLEVYLKADKNFIDANRIAKDIKRTPAWTFDKLIYVNSPEQIPEVLGLIKQAYECVCNNL